MPLQPGYAFWDVVGGSNLGPWLGDSFEKAGGAVELGNFPCEVVVYGLEMPAAQAIANRHGADYLGIDEYR